MCFSLDNVLCLSGWLDVKNSSLKEYEHLYCRIEDGAFAAFFDEEFAVPKYRAVLKSSLISLEQDLLLLEYRDSKIYVTSDDKSVLVKWYNVSKALVMTVPNYTMDDFEILSVIGRGLFGKVMLVQNRKTLEKYAIKSVHKKQLIESGSPTAIIAERNIMMLIEHPFIVKLHFAFQTANKFYLGLEYLPGGELFFHLQKVGTVKLENARIYTAEIALALDHLHRYGIVYRDLKPENILFDENGHVKLTDFGLAKDLYEIGSTKTFCGTNHYLAPEIIQRKPYSYEIDWWALGILLCEMLSGFEPFSGETRAELFNSILTEQPKVIDTIDSDAADLIVRLLEKNPKHRPMFDGIKDHPFFKPLRWEQVIQKNVQPTYIPYIRNLGTHNFDAEFTREDAIDSPGSGAQDVYNVDDFSFRNPLSGADDSGNDSNLVPSEDGSVK